MANIKAVLVKDGKATVVALPQSGDVSELVGGYIEFLRVGDDAHAYIDEEGKLKGLPVNEVASQFCGDYRVGLRQFCGDYRVGLQAWDHIVGPMLILGSRNASGEEDGAEHSVPKHVVAYFAARE